MGYILILCVYGVYGVYGVYRYVGIGYYVGVVECLEF